MTSSRLMPTKGDALALGQTGLTLADAVLDCRGAFDRIDNAGELDQHAIAHQRDDAAAISAILAR